MNVVPVRGNTDTLWKHRWHEGGKAGYEVWNQEGAMGSPVARMFVRSLRPAQQANVTRKPSTVDRLFPDNEVIQRVVGDSRYEETTEIECPAQRFLLLRKNFFFRISRIAPLSPLWP